MAEPFEDPATGTRVGRYLVLRRLSPPPGAPGPGRSFLALDRGTGEEVVLVLPADQGGDQALFFENLSRARALAAPGLPTVLAGGFEGTRAYLAYSWTPGVKLTSALAAGPLPEEGAARLLWEIAAGVQALHAHGLVHGDLRPGNVILTEGGGPLVVGYVPGPFGHPLEVRGAAERVPRYAPPEWHEGRVVSAAGDLYSLALLAYQLFTGRPLLPAESEAGTLENQQRLQQALGKARRVAPAIPEALDPVLRAMLDRDRSKRPRLDTGLQAALLQVLPTWSLDHPLHEALGGGLDLATARLRGSLLDEARRAVRASDALGAATALKRFAEVARGAGEGARERALELLREAAWMQFGDGLRGEVAEAALGSLFKAAIDLSDPELITVTRHRLGQVADPAGPLAAFLPLPEEVAHLEARVPVLKKGLAADPRRDGLLLGLAVATPGFHPRPEDTPSRRRAQLLERHGLLAGALFHRAQDLPAQGADRDLLEDLRQLAAQALEEAGDDEALTFRIPDDLDEHELSQEGDLALAATPPAEVGQPATSQQALRKAGVLADAEVLFTQGQILIGEGRLREATASFRQLVEVGALADEQYHAVLCKELQRVLWSGLLARATPREDPGLFPEVLGLARSLGLVEVLPLCERLVRRAARDQPEILAAGLEAAPGSALLLEAAAEAAAEGGDAPGQARHLLALAEVLVEAGEVVPAGRRLDEAAGAGAAEAEVAQLRGRLADARQRRTRANDAFHALEPSLVASQDPDMALREADAFLREYPTHLMALERALWLARRAGDEIMAVRLLLVLARRRLLRGEEEAARALLRETIEREPGNREALLNLAALGAAPDEEVDDLLGLRVAVLRREGLLGPARQIARRALQGGSGDRRVHALLVDLCRELDEDPTPHLMAQGQLAMRDGDEEVARAAFEAAAAEARRRGRPPEDLATAPGVGFVFLKDVP